MDSDEAHHALLGLINSEQPSGQNGATWDRITHSFSVALPNQRLIGLLVETTGNQLMGQLADTMCRMFMQDPKNVAMLATGSYQGYAAAVAALPQRMVDLRAARGAEFCEIVRRTIEERWAARDAVPPWHVINDRRETELAHERRMMVERVVVVCDEGSWEM